jgi:hypothetical protein
VLGLDRGYGLSDGVVVSDVEVEQLCCAGVAA